MKRSVVLALEVFFLLALLLGALREHAARGVESELLVMGLLLAPAHVRRLLALLGRGPPPRAFPLLLELACFGGLASYPVASFAVSLALLVAVTHALETQDRAPAPDPSLSGVVLVLALGAGLALGHDLAQGRELSSLRFVMGFVIFAETLAPFRARSNVDSLRRVSAFLALVATSVSPGEGLDSPFRFLSILAIGLASLVHLLIARVPEEERPRARRRLVFKLLVPVISPILLLAAGELAIRLVPNRYFDLVGESKGEWHTPGKTWLYEGAPQGMRQRPVLVHWNQHGYHDADHALEKPPGTTRVLVLGDSYIDGIQVETEELYHRQLERALAQKSARPVEAIALGWCGWGQLQEREALLREGLGYRPDLVIVEFLPGNNVRNNEEELERLAIAEVEHSTYARVLHNRAVRHRLFFHAFLLEKIDLVLRRLDGDVEAVDTDVYRVHPRRHGALWERAWEKTEQLVADMNASVARSGAKLVVVVFDSEAEILGLRPSIEGGDLAVPVARMRAICAAHEIPCLELAPRLARRPFEVRSALHLRGDGHWTAPGHREAALETAAYLVDETDLWKRALAHTGSR